MGVSKSGRITGGAMREILLIERDPFVRLDMQQALELAFDDHVIRDHGDVAALTHDVLPRLILIDLPAVQVASLIDTLGWGDHNLPIVLTGARGVRADAGFWTLPRPFTDAALIEIARRALGQV